MPLVILLEVMFLQTVDCLDDNYVHINLRSGVVKGYSPFISFLTSPVTSPGSRCDKQVVLRIDFSGKYHGAKFFLDYSEPPRFWTLDISDSPTGDGYGGDHGTTSNMAETQIHNKQLRVYGNDLPGHMDASSNGGLLIHTTDNFVKRGSRVKLDISDERIQWKSGKIKDFLESKFLFTLNGQEPLYGIKDNFLYVGLNRVVAGNYRNGSGLCDVTISLYSFPGRRPPEGNACEKGTHNCHKDAICINTRRRFRCRCRPGYYGNGKLCYEINECIYDNGGCVHFCQNTKGNYTCSCKNGFELDSDGHNCIDKNECLQNKGGCHHQCLNTLGGYECKCNAGYSLSKDGRSCQYGTWCTENVGCDHHCDSSTSGPQCACRPGYTLISDGKHCQQTCAVGNGGCQHNCTDTTSGPVCSCAPKYLLMENNKTCIASCDVNNGGCDRECIDSRDGPKCQCPSGFHLHQDGRTCLDEDECAVNNGGCSHKCLNTEGSYECVCPKGFKVQYNQRVCVDINECELNTTCDHHCVNTPGSYYCTCREGYKIYGVTHCADKNECLEQNGGCQHSCANTEGSFKCFCKTGYKLHSNGKDCLDWNNCLPFESPAKTLTSCKQTGADQYCSIQCEANTHPSGVLNTNKYYTCGPSTQFQWSHSLQNVTLPFCSENMRAPSVSKTIKFVFVATRCRVKRRLRHEVQQNITSQLNTLKKFKCRNSCKINYVQIDCKRIPKKFRRLARDVSKTVIAGQMELEVQPFSTTKKCDIPCTTKRTERRLKKAYKTLRKMVNKEQLFFRYDKQDVSFAKRSLKTKKVYGYDCPDGSIMAEHACVDCGVGSYYNKSSLTCEPCRPGTYQDREGQTVCKACPPNIQGGGLLGAKSTSECSILCGPGTYSSSGQIPCKKCPRGKYQTDYGRTRCEDCGVGLSTIQDGAMSFRDCSTKVTCAAGNFFDVLKHQCLPCPVGTYQPTTGLNFCYACPVSTSTDFVGSTNQSDCKNQECGGQIGKLQGYIESPNFPGNYPNSIQCTWKIKPGKKRRILVIIPEIFLPKEDQCGDKLVMRKSSKPSSLTTYEVCETTEKPRAFTSRSRRLWVQFKSDSQNTAGGFSIPFVTYNEDYQPLIEDIVRDGRLYSSYQHQSILKDRKLLSVLMEVISQPYNYFKYANVSHTMMPTSFIQLLTEKVQRFFST